MIVSWTNRGFSRFFSYVGESQIIITLITQSPSFRIVYVITFYYTANECNDIRVSDHREGKPAVCRVNE